VRRTTRPSNHPRSTSEPIPPVNLYLPSTNLATVTTHIEPNLERPLPDVPFPNTSPPEKISPRTPISPGPRSSSLNRISHTFLNDLQILDSRPSSSALESSRSFDRRPASEATSSPGRHGRNFKIPPMLAVSHAHVPEDVSSPITFLNTEDDGLLANESRPNRVWKGQSVARPPRQRGASDASQRKSSRPRKSTKRVSKRPFRALATEAADFRPLDDVVVVTSRQPTSWGMGVWEEKAVEDVIPKLRELRVSTKKWT
jgi:hypothetical protein